MSHAPDGDTGAVMFGMFGGTKREGGDGHNTLPDGTAVHLVLYKYDSCPFCRRVFRVIDELDVNVEYRDTMMDRTAREDLVRRVGRSQVPCLFVDGKPMLESDDINRWLRSRFSETA